jgi:hypothetical protein
MIIITLARKPLPDGVSVAANVIEYGSGGMNIGASRVGDCESGRWPANLIMQHDVGCRVVGTRDSYFGGGVKASGGFVEGYELGSGFVGQSVAVSVWSCDPGCAVAGMDAQDADHKPGSTYFMNLMNSERKEIEDAESLWHSG